jgi:hypothetical protein
VGPRRPAIRAFWTPLSADGVEVEVYRGAELVAQMLVPSTAGQTIIAAGILPATTYVVRLRIAPSGLSTAWAGAFTVVTSDVRVSPGDLVDSLQTEIDRAFALADGIANGYVWEVDGGGILRLVSVEDGIGGAPLTLAEIAADYVRITGLTQIDQAVIEDLAVSSAFIDNLTVETANIANNAITSAKIGDAQITSAKIGDAQITNAKIGNASVDTLKVAGNSITTSRFAGPNSGSAALNQSPFSVDMASVVWTPAFSGEVLISTGGFVNYAGPNSLILQLLVNGSQVDSQPGFGVNRCSLGYLISTTQGASVTITIRGLETPGSGIASVAWSGVWIAALERFR